MKWRQIDAPPGRLFEGPNWVEGAEVFQWVDILQATIHRWDPYADQTESRDTELEFATMALPLDEDRSLVASKESLHVYSWRKREMSEVGRWDFPEEVRFNDGGISPDGDIYVGTMSMRRTLGMGSLYRFELASGSLDPVVEGVGISNGIGWKTDTTAYYIDSLRPQVDRLVFAESRVTREPWVQLDPGDEPDGLAVAPDGSVCVALWGRGIARAVQSTGDGWVDYEVPSRFPTSMAFGGTSGELVVVTNAEDSERRIVGQVLVGQTAGMVGGGHL